MQGRLLGMPLLPLELQQTVLWLLCSNKPLPLHLLRMQHRHHLQHKALAVRSGARVRPGMVPMATGSPEGIHSGTCKHLQGWCRRSEPSERMYLMVESWLILLNLIPMLTLAALDPERLLCPTQDALLMYTLLCLELAL